MGFQKNFVIAALIAASLPWVVSPVLAADTTETSRSCWLSYGGGGGSAGWSTGGCFSYQKGGRIIGARILYTAELHNYGILSLSAGRDIWDLGVIYGLATHSDKGAGTVGAGIGLAGTSSEQSYKWYPALLVEVQLIDIWAPIIGGGAYIYGNLNSELPNAGVMLCLLLGDLR
jgi:hypothetical protein